MSKELTLKNEELQFEALKKKSIEIAAQVDKIMVTDDTTKAIAVQNISLMKSVMKEVEDAHKELKAPYWYACKVLDGLKNGLYDPMKKSCDAGTLKVLSYDQEVRRKAAEEQNRIIAIKNAIVKYSNDTIAEMNSCTDMEKLREVRTRLIVNAPKDKWAEFLPDFEAMILNLNDYAKSRRTVIETPVMADPEESIAIAEVIVENASVIGIQEIIEAKVEKQKGVRTTWGFEVVDLSQLPLEWLMPDEAKIKLTMKVNADKLEDGKVVNGVKFFLKESLSIR